MHHFGWRITLAKARCIWSNDSKKNVRKKNQVILQYLEKEYRFLIEKYENKTEVFYNNQNVTNAPIWVFWWQGTEGMPDIIRLCQKKREDVACQHPVIMLTEKNVRDYVEFPEDIWELFASGRLRVQHLADMIRVQLIMKYGGLWLDASIYCHKGIPERFFSRPFFSLHGEYMPQFVSGNRWTTFLIGGQAGNILCSFLNEFFITYCQRGKPFIDYFLFDCAIALAYEKIALVQKEIDAIPLTDGDCYWLDCMLDKQVSRELLTEMDQEPSVFYKISWKKPWDQYEEDSLYRYLLKINQIELR